MNNRAGFAKGTSFHVSYIVLKGNSGIFKHNGNFLWYFVQNSRLRKICIGTSVVEKCYRLSSTKVDAQSVINWAVVDQLSRQFLRRSTASLSQVIVKVCLQHVSVVRVN